MMLCRGTILAKADVFYDITNGVFNDINCQDEDFLEAFELLMIVIITFPM